MSSQVHASRGDGEEEELPYDFEDFEKICKSCNLIEQLSIAFPPTSLIRPNTDAFQSFEVSLTLHILYTKRYNISGDFRRSNIGQRELVTSANHRV
jgi:hypothetical protein